MEIHSIEVLLPHCTKLCHASCLAGQVPVARAVVPSSRLEHTILESVRSNPSPSAAASMARHATPIVLQCKMPVVRALVRSFTSCTYKYLGKFYSLKSIPWSGYCFTNPVLIPSFPNCLYFLFPATHFPLQTEWFMLTQFGHRSRSAADDGTVRQAMYADSWTSINDPHELLRSLPCISTVTLSSLSYAYTQN